MNAELQSHFDKVLAIVRDALASGGQSCYFPTLVTVEDDHVRIDTLFRGLPDFDILRAVERFGYRTGKRKRIPEFLFFSAESVSSDASDQIMVSGCSKQFEVIVGYLTLGRSPSGHLIPDAVVDVGSPTDEDVKRVPAWHAMNGAIAKSKAPWWHL